MQSKEQPSKRTGLKVMYSLIGLVKPLIGFMILAILLGVLGFLSAIFINVTGTRALAVAIGYGSKENIARLFKAIIVFGILRGFLHYGEQLCNHYIAFHILALIRDRVFTALRRLSPAKMETRDKGNLISIITSDIELLEVFYAHTISPICIAVLTCTFMAVFFYRIDPILCMVACLGYLAVGLFMPWIVSVIGGDTGAQYRNEFGDFNSFFLDSLMGLRETIQFGCEKKRLKQIEKRIGSLSVSQKRIKMFSGFNAALTACFVSGFSILMLVICLNLYENNVIGFNQVLVGTVAMMSSFGPVIALSGLSNNLLHTFASGNRVLDILEEEPVTEPVNDGYEITRNQALCIDGEDVNFAYDKEKVIKDLNISLRDNGVTGINGPSGCGKSTLLKLIMRFWDVDSGSLKLSGKDIREINTWDLRDVESYVTQSTELFQGTIEDNIRIGKYDASHQEIVKAAKAASLHDFIESLEDGYDTEIGELGDRLSGGEKQRIGVARAFLDDSPIMLLDEPTSNLDSLNEGIILKSLNQERDKRRILLVSHRNSTMGIADNVYRMKNGRLY